MNNLGHIKFWKSPTLLKNSTDYFELPFSTLNTAEAENIIVPIFQTFETVEMSGDSFENSVSSFSTNSKRVNFAIKVAPIDIKEDIEDYRDFIRWFDEPFIYISVLEDDDEETPYIYEFLDEDKAYLCNVSVSTERQAQFRIINLDVSLVKKIK